MSRNAIPILMAFSLIISLVMPVMQPAAFGLSPAGTPAASDAAAPDNADGVSSDPSHNLATSHDADDVSSDSPYNSGAPVDVDDARPGSSHDAGASLDTDGASPDPSHDLATSADAVDTSADSSHDSAASIDAELELAAPTGELEHTLSPLAASYTIDLGTTTASGTGYSVSGTAPTRILSFTTAASGNSYLIQQTGVANFSQIAVQNGVDVSITIEDIDVKSTQPNEPTLKLEANASLNLMLSGSNLLTQTATGLGNNAALSVPADARLFVSGNGNLTAQGGTRSAGIGGNHMQKCGTITINGGTVTATGGSQAAGIGGGNFGAGGTITINDGTVTATSTSGAGIGGGFSAAGGTITINGGTITATGTIGAGIGGGLSAAGGTVAIHGGTVTATGTSGAGIGGGEDGNPAAVTIDAGATVKAYSSQNSDKSRPAIHADSAGNQGSGFYVNAYFTDPPSATAATTLKVYGDSGSSVTESLILPANYRCFAYTTGGAARADAIDAYDAAGTTRMNLVVRDDDGSPVIPSARVAAELKVKLMELPTGHPLTISKKVANDYADTAKRFSFTLWLYKPDGSTPLPANTRLAYTGGVLAGSGATAPESGTLTLDAEGKASFSLSHGQFITIDNVTEGSRVRILEDLPPASPYVPSFTDGEDGPITQGADTGVRPLPFARHSFAFTNTMLAPPATGLGDLAVSNAIVPLVAAVPFALVLAVSRLGSRRRERRG
ncbi:MAG: hypothetical protein LBP24_04115 [Coriobacteriales bacterium]|nr:hypothetical protein [Coriobacteriales bacterium]